MVIGAISRTSLFCMNINENLQVPYKKLNISKGRGVDPTEVPQFPCPTLRISWP